MKRFALVWVLVCTPAYSHDIITTKITFNREIVRIFHQRCISCHSSGKTAFPLTTYAEARPWAKAIEEEVLQRRMPPWGAVKGFGNFRNDQGLTMEQLELIVDWAEGGAPEGEPNDLPRSPQLVNPPSSPRQADAILVSGEVKLARSIVLDALWPKTMPDGASLQVTAELPDGSITPLIWLQNYNKQFDHAFLLRTPVTLPAGTTIHGVPPDASIALLPVARPTAKIVDKDSRRLE